MSAITSIEIENFRCFRRLRAEGLTPVTLVVGANNAGKTAFLEAVEAVVSERSPFTLYRASFERGEFRRRSRGDEESVELDVGHWFHGHDAGAGAALSIKANGDRVVRRIVRRSPGSVPGFVLALEPPLALDRDPATGEEAGENLAGVWVPGELATLPLTLDGFLVAGAPGAFTTFGPRLKPPVSFVTTDRLFPSELSQLWANVVLTPAEQRTVDALRLVEPSVERIAMTVSDGSASVRVLLRGAAAPVPLGTLGEGVARILTLALHLAVAQGGFLLIDEMENGLHWSVMPKLWRFLVETARTLDVQVFATTHSKDCLEGLAELHRTQPTLAEHVSVHRLDAGREAPVRFDAGRITEYLQMELEAR